MRDRCYRPKSSSYRWYGGKGVGVCGEWSDFGAFEEWATSNGWQHGLDLDRVDPELDYSPENCRFVSKRENIKRARASIPASVDQQLIAEAAKRNMGIEALIIECIVERYAA